MSSPLSLSIWPSLSSCPLEPWRAKANAAAQAWHTTWPVFAAWLAVPLASEDKHEQAFSPLSTIGEGKGGRIKGGPAGFLALEYDEGATTALLQRAADVLAHFDAVLYTSASATAECPRFRVVVRIDRPIVDDGEYRACVDHFGLLVGTPPASESRQRTRVWYRPITRCSVRVLEGGRAWDVGASVLACPPPPVVERLPVDVSAFAADVRWQQTERVLRLQEPEGCFAAALICRDHALEENVALAMVRIYAANAGWDFADDELAARVTHAYEYAREPAGNALLTSSREMPQLNKAIETAPEGEPPVSAGHHVQNDGGNADRLISLFGPDLRYCEGLGWLRWDGRRWKASDGPWREAENAARLLRNEGIRIGGEVGDALEKWGRKSGNAKELGNCIKIAEHRTDIRIEPDALDADPWILNVQNGIVDLRTGVLRPHRREDYCTKIAGVDYDATATCPRFRQFLDEVLGTDLTTYMLAFLGHALTGLPADRCFQVWFGQGANGKSTLIEILLRIMGDYARPMSIGLLLESRHKRNSAAASPDLAALRGVRFASCVETEAGQRWNESMIKQLTGGDSIVARHLHREEFTIRPTWKIAVATNHRPIVRGSDAAIWDRIHLVPFEARFIPRPSAPVDIEGGPYQDPGLREALVAEAPGILALLVAGCRVWNAQGLAPPERVVTAVAEYRAACDVVGSFLEECCERGPEFGVSKVDLFRVYKSWALEAGEYVHGKQAFNRLISERKIPEEGTGGRTRWLGIKIASQGLAAVVR